MTMPSFNQNYYAFFSPFALFQWNSARGKRIEQGGDQQAHKLLPKECNVVWGDQQKASCKTRNEMKMNDRKKAEAIKLKKDLKSRKNLNENKNKKLCSLLRNCCGQLKKSHLQLVGGLHCKQQPNFRSYQFTIR